ncbi:BTB/POZ protein [Glomus cerebriforme]|uniref:BTB/POZ protein n=1 Tax=Glomus cerebriforme TaxID=658196 RepID=A0A397TEM1_9GLOM|nr:BTB/POZ protein [Glomus cerebriforme]
MSIIMGKASFEFTIPECEEIEGKNVYSPIFSTADNMFWQLEYQPNDPEDSNYCLIFLTAIPNPEEAATTQFWSDRANISASLFFKYIGYNRTYKLTTHDYSVRCASWGKSFNKNRNNVTATMGVIFENSIIELKGYNPSLTINPESKDIIETWARQLNVPENSDVLFNVKDGIVYANKSILSQRSEYFYGFFNSGWAEISNKQRKQVKHGANSDSTNTFDKFIIIDVPDISKVLFLEMLRYLYTDEVRFNLVSAIEIFRIADKYLLTKLCQKARVEIFRKLNCKNAMSILFNEAWKWNELKDDIINFIVNNFQKVKDTSEYKKLSAEHKGHPAGIEIFQEILDKILAK